MDDDVAQARAALAGGRRIAVLTGAGISTDSGIRDFRGPKGLWTLNPEAEKASHIEHYLGDAEVRRAAWARRLEGTGPRPAPNEGHRALVDLERTGRLHTLVTQNVDGLHLDAGTDPARLVEVHGTTRAVGCLACGERGPLDPVLARVQDGEDDPPCRTCGGILKVATISFGQGLLTADLERADHAARSCDVLLAVGTTLAVYPVAEMVPLAAAQGAGIVIVNDSPTAMDDLADVVVRGSISEVLPAMVSGIPPLA